MSNFSSSKIDEKFVITKKNTQYIATLNFKSYCDEAGEIAQRVPVLAALPEILSSIPSNHMVASNHL